MNRTKLTTVLLAALAAFSTRSASAQAPEANHCATRSSTRSALQSCIEQLDSLATDPGAIAVRRDLDLARRRLAEGDFRVGDLIILTVAGESVLTDTFMVQDGLRLSLPTVGAVPLAGVLRGELLPHLSAAIGRYLRNPTVDARPLLRLSVVGEVERPGFYPVRVETVLSDVLMYAGGLTREANPSKLKIIRGRETLVGPEAVQQALAAGQTVDELALRDGDRLMIPRRGGIGFDRVLMVVLALPTAIFAITQLTRDEPSAGR